MRETYKIWFVILLEGLLGFTSGCRFKAGVKGEVSFYGMNVF